MSVVKFADANGLKNDCQLVPRLKSAARFSMAKANKKATVKEERINFVFIKVFRNLRFALFFALTLFEDETGGILAFAVRIFFGLW